MVTALRRRYATACVALIGVAVAFLLPPAPAAAAGGAIWLPTQQATFTLKNILVPSMATYRNHAYILWLGDVPPGKTTTQIFFTTNASGAWKTRLLSAAGPNPGGVVGNGPNVFMAVDPSIKRLYAVWSNGTSGSGAQPMWCTHKPCRRARRSAASTSSWARIDLLQACYNTNPDPGQNLFYTPEFEDIVGPATQITGISAAGPGAIRVAWRAASR